MGFEINLVSSLLAKVVSYCDMVGFPGCQRVPVIKQVATVYPALDGLYDLPLDQSLADSPESLEVVMQSKYHAVKFVQIAHSYMPL